jgi:hypothetical protein
LTKDRLVAIEYNPQVSKAPFSEATPKLPVIILLNIVAR